MTMIVARFLMRAEAQSVTSHGNILLNPFMEEFNDVDQALSYLTFSTGATGDIEGSRNASYGYDIRGEMVGTKEHYLLDHLSIMMSIFYK